MTRKWGWPEPYKYGVYTVYLAGPYNHTIIYCEYIQSWPTLHVKCLQMHTQQPSTGTMSCILKEISSTHTHTHTHTNTHTHAHTQTNTETHTDMYTDHPCKCSHKLHHTDAFTHTHTKCLPTVRALLGRSSKAWSLGRTRVFGGVRTTLDGWDLSGWHYLGPCG